MKNKKLSNVFILKLIVLLASITLFNFTTIRGQTISNQTTNIKEQRLLLTTTIKNNSSKPQELTKILNSFLNEDPNNIELLLDIVLPESITVQQISSSTIFDLIKQLSSDNYSEVKNAILELYLIGPAAEPQIKKKYDASANPLEAIFLQGIISRWELTKLNDHECSQIQNIVSEYIKNITDIPMILSLQKRALSFLDVAKPDHNQQMIIKWISCACAKTGDDSIVNKLLPLLDHPDISFAVNVVDGVGNGFSRNYFPEFLLTALNSDREQIVSEAIPDAIGCYDMAKIKTVKSRLDEILNGDNETLKLKACFPLMYRWGDQSAMTYLFSQAHSDDKQRAIRAISWIGDAQNSGKPEYPELLESLVPLLKSENNEIRRAASDALGTYSGENVIRNLIAMLTDKEEIIFREARNNLFDQRDKNMVQRLLKETLEKTKDESLISKIRELQNAINTNSRIWNK